MAQSYTLIDPPVRFPTFYKSRTVLVTGATGRIGSYFAKHNHDRYGLTLMVEPGVTSFRGLAAFGKVAECDLCDLDRLKNIFESQDTIVHLDGVASPEATWTELLNDNIIGCYNAFVAAKSAGCRRIVYASSIHAVSGYPVDVQVKSADPVNPGDLYGVSKCFGEAMGRYMAEQQKLSCIAIRIGAFQPIKSAKAPDGLGLLDAFVSHRDLNHLIQQAIDIEGIGFAIVSGLSDNRFKRLDITEARELLAYRPVDDATSLNSSTEDLNLAAVVEAHDETGSDARIGIREELS